MAQNRKTQRKFRRKSSKKNVGKRRRTKVKRRVKKGGEDKEACRKHLKFWSRGFNEKYYNCEMIKTDLYLIGDKTIATKAADHFIKAITELIKYIEEIKTPIERQSGEAFAKETRDNTLLSDAQTARIAVENNLNNLKEKVERSLKEKSTIEYDISTARARLSFEKEKIDALKKYIIHNNNDILKEELNIIEEKKNEFEKKISGEKTSLSKGTGRGTRTGTRIGTRTGTRTGRRRRPRGRTHSDEYEDEGEDEVEGEDEDDEGEGEDDEGEGEVEVYRNGVNLREISKAATGRHL